MVKESTNSGALPVADESSSFRAIPTQKRKNKDRMVKRLYNSRLRSRKGVAAGKRSKQNMEANSPEPPGTPLNTHNSPISLVHKSPSKKTQAPNRGSPMPEFELQNKRRRIAETAPGTPEASRKYGSAVTREYSARLKSILRSPSLNITPESNKGKKSVTFEPLFKCIPCQISSISPREFITHLENVHCKQMKNLHSVARSKDKNFRQNTSQQNEKKCRICDGLFYNNADLAEHLEKHHSISEKDIVNYVPLTPNSCNGTVLSDLEEEEDEGEFERPCGLDLDLGLQNESVQGPVPPPIRPSKVPKKKCSICQKDFANTYLNQHKFRIHKIIIPGPRSGKSGVSKRKTGYALRSHKDGKVLKPQMHSTPEPVPASDENYHALVPLGTDEVPTRRVFKMARAPCSICGKEFNKVYVRKHQLRVHKVAVRQDRRTSKYGREVCDICNSSFSITYMETHKLTHQPVEMMHLPNPEESAIPSPVQPVPVRNRNVRPVLNEVNQQFLTTYQTIDESSLNKAEENRAEPTQGTSSRKPSCSKPLLYTFDTQCANGTSLGEAGSSYRKKSIKLEKSSVCNESGQFESFHRECKSPNKTIKSPKRSSMYVTFPFGESSCKIKASNSVAEPDTLASEKSVNSADFVEFRRTLC